ncbi:MAG: hypothetical protein HQL23_06765 [Candidatus Omnitrophica bacterium]|nr:hypothetical protein [Candidatus Omnitrophota bacterium]
MKKIILVFFILAGCAVSAFGQDAAVIFQDAKRSLAEGNKDFALMGFRKVVALDPDSHFADEAEFRVGQQLFQDKAYYDAQLTLQQHLKSFPQSPFRSQVELLLKGIQSLGIIRAADQAWLKDDWTGALALYQQALPLADAAMQPEVLAKIDLCQKAIEKKRQDDQKAQIAVLQEIAKENQEIAATSQKKIVPVPNLDEEFSLTKEALWALKHRHAWPQFLSKVKHWSKEHPGEVQAQWKKLCNTFIPLVIPLIVGVLIIWLFMYVYCSLCLQFIAVKTNAPQAWLAWIPFFNILLLCDIAKRPRWWILLYVICMCIPVIGYLGMMVLDVVLWMEIAQARQRESWIGVLILFPMANLFLLGYLAFTDAAPAQPGPGVPAVPPAAPVAVSPKPSSFGPGLSSPKPPNLPPQTPPTLPGGRF